MKFIRYGSLVPQKHTPDPESFHKAPVVMGFYAFPRGYVEPFLLGGSGSGSIENGRYRFVKDKNGKKIFDKIDNVLVKVKDSYEDIHRKWHNAEYKFTDEYKYLAKKYDPNEIIQYWKDSKMTVPWPDDDTPDDKWEEERKRLQNCETFFVEQNKPNYFDYNGEIWFHGSEVVPIHERIKTSGSWIKTDMKTYEKALKKMTDSFKFFHWRNWGRKYLGGNPGGLPLDNSKDHFEVFIEKLK